MSANLAGNVLDLFSGAAGGWSLGMHRAGFRTVAACEVIPWRRALYSVNNPAVRLYDDILTLTADRIVSDLGYLPDVVVGSPPCQDISSANTKGKGVDGDRSKLFFEAVRLVGECRPRWVALENSANLRTRGADRVLGALEDLGYSAWPFVVGAVHVGANHEWLRAWIIAFDTAQIGHDGGRSWGYGPDGDGEAYPRGRVAHTAKIGLRARPGNDESSDRGHDRLFAANSLGDGFRSFADADGDTVRVSKLSERPFAEAAFVEHADSDPSQDGWRAGRQGRCFEPVAGIPVEARGDDGDADGEPRAAGISPSSHEECGNVGTRCLGSRAEPGGNVDGSHADKDGEHDGAVDDEMGERAGVGGNVGEPWPEWNGGFANHLRMDDGLSAWVADTRVEVGTGRGTSAASLIVEAFGDAVIPEITYRIGRSIRRVETALAAIHGAPA